MRTVSSERSDGEKLQITKLAQHDEREKRLLEKKRITRFAQNTENNTRNITKMAQKKWLGIRSVTKNKSGGNTKTENDTLQNEENKLRIRHTACFSSNRGWGALSSAHTGGNKKTEWGKLLIIIGSSIYIYLSTLTTKNWNRNDVRPRRRPSLPGATG